MKHPDQDLRAQLKRSPSIRPRPGLAAQIIAHASALPQRHPWQWHLQRALDELRYGWQLKLASIALCGVLGLVAGQWQSSQLDIDNDVLLSAQAFDNALNLELL
jgi:hypothetical protein